MDRRFEDVLSRLEKSKETKAWGTDVVRQAVACCPAHDDKNPSLSIREYTSGWIDTRCWAGCTREEIVSAIGMRICDLGPINEWRPERDDWRDKDFCASMLLVAQSARNQGRKRTDQDRQDEVKAARYLMSINAIPEWYIV